MTDCAFFLDGHLTPDYQVAKPFLTIRPYPLEKAGASMRLEVGDIALVLYAVLREENGMAYGCKVPVGVDRYWGVSAKKLFEDAFEKVDPRVMDLLFFPIVMKLDEWDGVGNFCLTTEKKVNGSVAIFKPGVADRIMQAYGCGFYAAFTSIHEVMIHPKYETDVEILRDVIRSTIDECTQEDEILTREVYYYDGKWHVVR